MYFNFFLNKQKYMCIFFFAKFFQSCTNLQFFLWVKTP